MTIRVSVPGKLMLAGEWAVLELGVPCVVMAIDKKVTVVLTESDTIGILAPDLKLDKKTAVFDGKKLLWTTVLAPEEQEKLLIAQHAIETTLSFLAAKGKPISNFFIQTASEDCVVQLADGSTAKVGFGSSAAACVGIVDVILQHHGFRTNSNSARETVFKLGCLAHFNAQGKLGSSFDVAASTFGGMIHYERFDPKWVEEQAKSGKNLGQIVDTDWPSLVMEPLAVPQDFQLLIGYTGPDTSTKEMIKKVQACKEEKKTEYWQTINEIKALVSELIPGIKKPSHTTIVSKLWDNRRSLQKLAKLSGIELETPKLAELADIAEAHGTAGKFSGSGGGGLGIAVCFESKTRQKIEKDWQKVGIAPVKAGIAKPTTK